ncbi:hypothetical protein [Galbibacter sp. PAP.153]|uniref:hypothetical protein n=1 Tax=Galbibacter sp. PAP.153 TaxID=3104623 RepID=UPI00300915A7
MDELDFLKKDWQEREKELPKLSYNDIYMMMWKKSSSSVKWIFYISVIELTFGVLMGIFYHPSFEKELNLPPAYNYLTYASILVIIYFIIRFFRNYKRISTTSSVKGLLENIIKARRTVRQYIIFNLSFAGIVSIGSIIYLYIQQSGGWNSFAAQATPKDYLVIFVISVLATAIIIGFFLGIYYLLYGILMRKLKRNYNEIKKMEL